MSNAGGNGYREGKSGQSSVQGENAAVECGTPLEYLVPYREIAPNLYVPLPDEKIVVYRQADVAGFTDGTIASFLPANDAEGAD